MERLKRKNLSNLEWSKPTKFDEAYLKKTHDSFYIDEVKKRFQLKDNFLDGDTVISPGSKNASYDAVSSIVSAIDQVKNEKIKKCILCCSTTWSSC